MNKNPCAKTRDIDDPYEIWISDDGHWEWRVLKKYQYPENEKKNPNARWYCAVKSPFNSGRYAHSDTYVKNIIWDSKRIK